MDRNRAWERLKAGSQAAVIAGQIVWHAASPGPVPTVPDTSRTNDVSSAQRQLELQAPSMDELIQNAAQWDRQRARSERERGIELGYQLREPESREERGR